jgi:hypothetical protein
MSNPNGTVLHLPNRVVLGRGAVGYPSEKIVVISIKQTGKFPLGPIPGTSGAPDNLPKTQV